MAEGWEPFGITTEAGKELFIYMNMHYGSGVWGRVGEGVVEVEKEVTERIIALLEAELGPDFAGDSTTEPKDTFLSVKWIIALIKGEN